MNWVVSDIHGYYYTLKDLISRVLSADPDAQFIFVGDYVDRGPFSKEVVEYLIELQSQGKSVCLRGNHDDVIDKFLNGKSLSLLSDVCRSNINDAVLVEWWSVNGLLDTLHSYGAKFMNSSPFAVAANFRDATPQSHKEFFRNLLPSWENETHFCVHAWMSPYHEVDFPIHRIDTANLWERFPRHCEDKTIDMPEPTWAKIGVFGHTPTTHYGAVAPIKYGQMRLIDCGVFVSGYLVAYCTNADDFILQNPNIKDLEAATNDDGVIQL